jgi:N-acetylglucosamine-6-phosphate deacetylase
MSTLIRGATMIDGTSGDVLVVDGRIAAVGVDASAATGARQLDADALLLAPGFIDVQVNGAMGFDFTADPPAMWRAGEELARHGVTSFLATIISAPRGTIDAAIESWRSRPAGAAPGAIPIGLHLEGPFLSPGRAGAHPAGHLRMPDAAEAADWSPDAGVWMVTLAPELPGAVPLAKELAGRGVIVAAGHSEATTDEARAAFDAGARYVTHLWNAMAPLEHRAPGLIGAALTDQRVTVGLIGDGVHVAPEILEVTWHAAAGRVSLVSDAMAGLGMAPGEHRLGEREVTVNGAGAHLADGTLAGSVAGLDAGLRCLTTATGAGVAEVLHAVTSVPARLLGLTDGRGGIRVGGRADLVLLTSELEVASTLVAGEVAWAAEDLRWR